MQNEPVVHVTFGPDHRPLRAKATARVDHPAPHVWAALDDLERFATFLPMVSRVRIRDDLATFHLRFRIGLFSAGFEFTTRAVREPGTRIVLRWTAGEPRDIEMRFTITPIDERACTVDAEAGFDPRSLGWLAKYFLGHHPEIEYGIFPGVTLVLLDSIRRAADARA